MVSMVFFGIELNTGRFTINPFLYMSVMGVMDLPAYTLMAPILVRLGRKGPLVVCYFISGAIILGLAFVAPSKLRLKGVNGSIFFKNPCAGGCTLWRCGL